MEIVDKYKTVFDRFYRQSNRLINTRAQKMANHQCYTKRPKRPENTSPNKKQIPVFETHNLILQKVN